MLGHECVFSTVDSRFGRACARVLRWQQRRASQGTGGCSSEDGSRISQVQIGGAQRQCGGKESCRKQRASCIRQRGASAVEREENRRNHPSIGRSRIISPASGQQSSNTTGSNGGQRRATQASQKT